MLKLILPLLFGCGIFWVIYKDVDVDRVVSIIRQGISWTWVVVSLVFAWISHVLRGLRWRLQLRTMGANPSAHDMSVSVFGNYGLNLVFPRLGEFWRCNYVSQVSGLSFSKSIGSMISERLVDMICAATMALAAFLLQKRVFFSFLENSSDFGARVVNFVSSPWLWIGIILFVLLMVSLLRILRGSRFYDYISRLIHRLWQGVMSIMKMKNWSLYLLYSIAIWGAYYVNSYTSLFFFDFTSHLDPLAGLAIFVMGSLSLLVPVQGGLGAWHAAVIFALGCYGIGEAEALSFALVSWAIEQGFVLLLGLYALVYVFIRKKQTQ